MKKTIASVIIAAVIAAPICGYAEQNWYTEPEFPVVQTIAEPIPVSVEELERQRAVAEAEQYLSQKGIEVPEYIADICERVGTEYGIEPELLEAIGWKESRYDSTAVSGTNKGICQVSTYWHADRMTRLGVTDIFDPEQNIRIAADLLAELSDSYDSTERVLMAYNGDHRKTVSKYATEVVNIKNALRTVHSKGEN